MSSVFASVVIPSLEVVPLMEITQTVDMDDLSLLASYEISQAVFTEFDRRLSDHLAATKGEGFPSLSLTIRIADPESGKDWSPINQQYYHSLPHVLRRVAEFALGTRERTEIQIFQRSRKQAGPEALSRRALLERTKVEALTAAIDFCSMLGDVAFLHVTGDYRTLVVQPSDRAIQPAVIDLERGTITIPSDHAGPGHVFALYNPARQIGEHPEASTYVTRAHHSQAMAKEKAIWDFRAASEERIFGFDRALGEKPLVDYRLTAAETLVARLRAGLGDSLLGLSEEAQIIALGWARQSAKSRAPAGDQINRAVAKAQGAPGSRVRLISNE